MILIAQGTSFTYAFYMTSTDSRRRILLLLVLSAATLGIGWGIQYLEMNTSVNTALPADNPDFEYNEEVERIFGANDELYILVEGPEESVIHADFLTVNQAVIETLGTIEEVEQNLAISLNSIFPPPLDLYSSEQISSAINADPMLGSQLLADDLGSALIIFPMATELGFKHDELIDFIDQVDTAVEDLGASFPQWSFSASGHPVINGNIIERMQENLLILFPIAIAAVMVIIAVVLRSLRGTLIPILITLFAVIWTFGLKGFLRSPITITESVIPVVLISIACADGIHIISEYFHNFHHFKNPLEATIHSMDKLRMPIILTSITTALGFTSFIFAPGSSLRNMGLFLAFGVMVAMIYSLFFIPALLKSFVPGSFKRNQATKFNNRTTSETNKEIGREKRLARNMGLFRGIEHLTQISISKRWWFLAGTVVILGASLYGVFNVSTDTDEIRYFKESDKVRLTAEKIEQQFGGISMINLVLEGPEGRFNSLDSFTALDSLSNELGDLPGVSTVVSAADMVKYINYGAAQGNPDSFVIPGNWEYIAALLGSVSIEGGTDGQAEGLSQSQPSKHSPNSFITPDGSRVRINLRLPDSSTSIIRGLIDPITDAALEHFPDITPRFAGDFIRLRNGEIIIESQIISLLTTLITIVIVTSLIFRSLWQGLLVSTPVFVAVLFNFFIMWAFGVTLNPGTSIIASVGLGVGIDYSIHYFHRFKALYHRTGNFHESLIDAAAETGRGILSNALAVGAGFLILLVSAYTIINDMGWIIALSMATTAIASLTLLPATLTILGPRGISRPQQPEGTI